MKVLDSIRVRFTALAVLRFHPGLWLALSTGLALKAVLIATGSITFDADEAVVALMARHITQGARPIFFYGQNYMGALDAYLIALAFSVLGERVVVVRLVQTILFLGVVGTNYVVSLRLSRTRWAATAAALLVAIPPVLVGLYTTATLGDYVETLLLGNLLLLIGWRLAEEPRGGPIWPWALWGFLAGLGWWGMALMVVTATPIAVYVLRRHIRHPPWRHFALAMLGGLVGAAPWLLATIREGFGATVGDAAGVWIQPDWVDGLRTGWWLRIFNLLAFNLPALMGLRPPWSVDWIALSVGIVVAVLYLLALWTALRRADDPPARARRLTLVGGWGVLLALFVLSPFGRDPTGRYLLPLYPLLAVLLVDWVVSWRVSPWLAIGVVGLLLAYNLWGTLRAVRDNPPGLSTQFDPISVVPEDHDEELLAFLDDIGVHNAYTNYWVTFRFAFLTGESVNLAPRLPYKANMSYTWDDNRIPAYTEAVDAGSEVVYITTNHPVLDAELAQRFGSLGVSFNERQIGPYHVFYDLSRAVRPSEIEPFMVNSFDED
jgi:hypothetical protein